MTVRAQVTAGLLALAMAGCGGGSTPVQPPGPSPTATPAPQPSPTPTPAPSPSPTPGANKCGSLPPGPVTRYAITPREQRTDDQSVNMRVRALPNWDEVWCVDKDKTHRLDFNSNQRNADGRECCWVNDPTWRVEDPNDMVESHNAISGTNSFNYRIRLEPRGRRGTVYVEAEVDGVLSFPWQSGAGYRREPLRIVTLAASEIERDCKCIFRGNGQYEGVGCTK